MVNEVFVIQYVTVYSGFNGGSGGAASLGAGDGHAYDVEGPLVLVKIDGRPARVA